MHKHGQSNLLLFLTARRLLHFHDNRALGNIRSGCKTQQCRSQQSMSNSQRERELLTCALSAAYSHRPCRTLSLAGGGLGGSGSGSVRGQVKASVPAGDHKKKYNKPPSLGWERRNQEAFQFSLPSPSCRPQAARHTAYHSTLHCHGGWAQLQLRCCDAATPVKKLRVVKVPLIMRLAGIRSRHLEPQSSPAR